MGDLWRYCFGLCKGRPGGLPTGKNYTPERTRLGSVAGFNPPECNGEPPPGVRAFMITLNPAPGKFKHTRAPRPTHTNSTHGTNTLICTGSPAAQHTAQPRTPTPQSYRLGHVARPMRITRHWTQAKARLALSATVHAPTPGLLVPHYCNAWPRVVCSRCEHQSLRAGRVHASGARCWLGSRTSEYASVGENGHTGVARHSTGELGHRRDDWLASHLGRMCLCRLSVAV